MSAHLISLAPVSASVSVRGNSSHDGLEFSAVGQTVCGIFVLAFGIHGEPTFDDAFALVEKLADAPQTREAHDGRECSPEEAAHKQGSDATNEAHKEEYPPRARAKIILGFHDEWVEDADDQEGADAKHYALPIDVCAEDGDSVHEGEE